MKKIFLQLNSPVKTSIEELSKAIQVEFEVSLEDMHKRSKKRSYSEARQALAYIANKFLKKPAPALAQYLKRDHSTLYYGIKSIDSLLISDDTFRDKFFNVLARIPEILVLDEDEEASDDQLI